MMTHFKKEDILFLTLIGNNLSHYVHVFYQYPYLLTLHGIQKRNDSLTMRKKYTGKEIRKSIDIKVKIYLLYQIKKFAS